MDLTHSQSIDIAASPHAVYDLVSDVTRTGEWSPVCAECWWDDGDGPRVGARFTGRNVKPERTWETRSTVVVADPGREFAWEVGEGFARWGYAMEPTHDNLVEGTRLTESWTFTPAGLSRFRDRFGDDADREIEVRRVDAVTGIPLTLAAIKAVAEATS